MRRTLLAVATFGVLVLAAGCGSTKYVTQTQTLTQATTETSTTTVTQRAKGQVVHAPAQRVTVRLLQRRWGLRLGWLRIHVPHDV